MKIVSILVVLLLAVTLVGCGNGGGVTPPPQPTTYTLTVNVTGQGTVTKNPDQTSYRSGTSVTVTAVPATGYEFTAWGGDLSGTTTPASITMNSNHTITATFTKLPVTGNTFSTDTGFSSEGKMVVH